MGACCVACRVQDLDPRPVMDHIELLLLVIDELVDGGYGTTTVYKTV